MSNHRALTELPPAFQAVCHAFVGGLRDILSDKLYGVYLYGAAVFADGGPVQDVDCHVILAERLTGSESHEIVALHRRLAAGHAPFGSELDAYVILFDAARLPQIPQHQLQSDVFDNAWALHCAHIRAGYFQTLHGSEPDEIFPAPAWESVAAALEQELTFIKANLRYPAYCVLNLCRIIYSFQTRDVVVSKRFAAGWASEVYPEWNRLIAAAERYYDFADRQPASEGLADPEVLLFLSFAEDQIHEAKKANH